MAGERKDPFRAFNFKLEMDGVTKAGFRECSGLDASTDPVDYPYRPSVDVFFDSLASAWPRPGVAVLLTGMGSDGARGLLRLRQHLAGRAAADLGAACQVLPLAMIPAAILDRVRQTQ